MKRRILSIFTALALCLSLCPTWAFAVEGEPDTGLCDHHPEHIGCGYTAPTEGHPCGHQHTAECYPLGILPDGDNNEYYETGADVEILPDCRHTHDGECGYVQAGPGTPCGYECAECGKTTLTTAVLNVQAMIDALPGVEEVEGMSPDGQREAYDRLQNACDAYETLTAEEQGQIEGAGILEELSRWFNSQTVPTWVSGGAGNDGPYWELDDEGTLTITVTGSGTTPQSFSYYKDIIKKVVVGEGITSIGSKGFQDCANLTEIQLPNSLISIGDYAFDGCTNLTLTKLPDHVTSIGMGAFWNCSSLALTELPDGIDSIRDYAFMGCSNLALTKLPDGVTSIDGSAFARCSNLALTKLPDNLISIDSSAFEGCTKLALTALPDGVTSIGNYTFEGCTSLGLTKLPDGVTSIGNYAFNGCTSLGLTKLPDGVTSIGNYAFYNCSSLELTKLPAGVTSIGEYAFQSCTNLALTELPDGLTSIKSGAFGYCPSLALTKLPDNLTTIENSAFSGCTNLALTKLPEGVASIGNYAFIICGSLALTELPDSLTSIGNSAFEGCTGLTELLFPQNTAPALGTSAFKNCTALDTIYIFDGSTGYTAGNNWPEEKIKVLAAPSFTSQPQNASVTVGETPTFRVEVSSGLAPTCQWQVNKGSSGWEDIPGATADTYTTAAADMSMNGWQYRCVATNDLGHTESTAATLTVNPMDLSGAAVTVSGAYTYTGQAIRPVNVTVELDGKQLTQGVDYILSYENNVNVGIDTAKVIVTGTGNYAGTANGTFTIDKAAQTAPATGAGFTINYAAETVTVSGSTYELAAANTAATGTDTLDITPGTNVYIRLKGTDTHAPSDWTEVAIPAQPTAPAVPLKLTKAADSIIVTGSYPGCEFSIDGTNWNDAGTFHGLTAGTEYTVQVRVKATGSNFRSDSVTQPVTTVAGDGSTTVKPGESIETGSGTTITNDGEKTSITGGGTTTTVIPPSGGGDMDVGADGGVTVPGGSTVQTGDTGPEITVGDKGGTVGGGGKITVPDGGSVQIGSGPATTITPPSGQAVTPNPGGTVDVPGGSTIKTGEDGPEIIVGNQGGTAGGDGGITVPNGGTVTVNGDSGDTTITLPNGGTVSPNPGGTLIVPEGSTIQTGNGDSVSAPAGGGVFDPSTGEIKQNVHTVTVNGGTGGGSYAPGATVTITATVPSGQRFAGWTVNEGGVTLANAGSATTTFTMPAQAVTVTANFQNKPSSGGGNGWYNPPVSYSITTSATANGKVTVSPASATQGTTVTVTATPENGYRLDSLNVTSGGKAISLTEKGGGKYTFTMPAGAVKVEAVFVPAETPWNNPFIDVAEGAWYYDAVRYVSENGLMGGYGNGKFGPNDYLSRAQLAQILFNKEGRPVVNYLMRYNDVANGAWYTEAIRWATSQGIVSGYGNGMFGPNDNITCEQLAAMLWRYAGSPAADNKELRFNDADEISGFALEAMRWAVENGIINGYGDGRLNPKGLATRAQVAQMLKNFLKK